jgi:arylsulfatase A
MDISPALLGTGPSPRDVMFFYRGTRLYAVRKGPFKAHFITQDAYGPGKPESHDPPLLYHLGHDPSEKYNVAEKHPDVIAEIRKLAEAHQAAMEPGEPQLEAIIGKE